MMYCKIHCIFFSEKNCPMCKAGQPPYLRTRKEVADPNEWARYKRLGWTR